jgi:hypothetical protein
MNWVTNIQKEVSIKQKDNNYMSEWDVDLRKKDVLVQSEYFQLLKKYEKLLYNF